MMKKLRITFFFMLISFTFYQCGTTKIITDRGINADIYVNGVIKGKKEAEIIRMGIPKKVDITAKYQGEIIGKTSARRKLDGATCLIGYLTNGIGLLVAWRYPAIIIIPTTIKPNGETDISPWDATENSIWMKPIKK
jgi:hypothetical protein